MFLAHVRASKRCVAPARADAKGGESLAVAAGPVAGIGCCSKSGALAEANPQLEAVVGCSGGTGQSEPARARALRASPKLLCGTGNSEGSAAACAYEC